MINKRLWFLTFAACLSNPVPEPATLSLLGLGIFGIAAKFIKRRG